MKTSYEYAGADMNKLLWQSTDGGAEYDYTYGTSDQNGVPVIATRTVTGTGTASVVTDPVTGQPLDLRTSDNVTSLTVLDGIGNPTTSIADTGKVAYQVFYDAYGAETVIKGGSSMQLQQNPYGFKTGLRSTNGDTGLTKFGYRWQSSTTGGWIERDTLDVPLSPSNANRYAYVGGEPISSSDPSGLDAYDIVYDSVCGIPAATTLTFGSGALGLAGSAAVATGATVGTFAYAGACARGSVPRYQPTLYADNPELLVATAEGY